MNRFSGTVIASIFVLGLWPAYGHAQYLPRFLPLRQFRPYLPIAPQVDPCSNSNAWSGMISWLNAKARLPSKVVGLHGLRTPDGVDFRSEGSTLVCFGQIVFEDGNRLVGWITVLDPGPGQDLQVTWMPYPGTINSSDRHVEEDQRRAVMPSAATTAETAAGDRQWEVDAEVGPCSKLRDRETDPPDIVAACHAHNVSMPRCVDYRNFAEVWFDLRTESPALMTDQTQVIDHMGTGSDEVLIERSPEFRDQLKRLLSATLSANSAKWRTGKAWGEAAYSRCMAGRFY
jgi:hypothetical protein